MSPQRTTDIYSRTRALIMLLDNNYEAWKPFVEICKGSTNITRGLDYCVPLENVSAIIS